MTKLREAARNMGRAHGEITTPMLYEALGAGQDDQAERARIRRRCNQMVAAGELTRIRSGVYRYNAGAAPARHGEHMTRMCRAIKSSATGFTQQDIARVSGATVTHVCKYFGFLTQEGYLRRAGKRGQSALYRATQKMRAVTSAPLPPRPLTDPFEDERRAVHELVGLFLLRDPYRPDVQRKILAACRAIEARFNTQK
jgi:hypothetical protein